MFFGDWTPFLSALIRKIGVALAFRTLKGLLPRKARWALCLTAGALVVVAVEPLTAVLAIAVVASVALLTPAIMALVQGRPVPLHIRPAVRTLQTVVLGVLVAVVAALALVAVSRLQQPTVAPRQEGDEGDWRTRAMDDERWALAAASRADRCDRVALLTSADNIHIAIETNQEDRYRMHRAELGRVLDMAGACRARRADELEQAADALRAGRIAEQQLIERAEELVDEQSRRRLRALARDSHDRGSMLVDRRSRLAAFAEERATFLRQPLPASGAPEHRAGGPRVAVRERPHAFERPATTHPPIAPNGHVVPSPQGSERTREEERPLVEASGASQSAGASPMALVLMLTQEDEPRVAAIAANGDMDLLHGEDAASAMEVLLLSGDAACFRVDDEITIVLDASQLDLPRPAEADTTISK